MTLVVNVVGYVTQEIDVYESEPLVISLHEDVNKINEVVVIGYGTQKREDLTGSIASIPTAALKESPVVSFNNGLQGKVAGVQGYLSSSLFEGSAAKGIASVGSKFNNTWLNENTLTYDKVFSKTHIISVLTGFTQQDWDV